MPDEVKLLPCPNAIYVRFVEGRYGTHIQKWAHEPFGGGTEYTRAIEATRPTDTTDFGAIRATREPSLK